MTEQERAAKERELVELLERVRIIARRLGLPEYELTAPLALRIDAWLERSRRLVSPPADPFYPRGTEW